MTTPSEMNQRIEICLGYGLLLIPLGVYYLLYFDGFFPITEGWFSLYAHLIRSGQMPYRDFFLLLPPLYPYQIAAFQAVFGESLLNLRYLGLFVTCGIGMVLFEILRCLFKPLIAAFAACVALLYYQSGNAFLGYDFTQFLTLYLLTGTMFLMRYCMTRNPKYASVYLFLSGLFLTLAALIKQSNGAIGAAAVLFAAIILIFRIDRGSNVTKQYLALCAGCAAPLACTFIWVSYNRLVSDFISNVFRGALQAKGGMHAVLVQWLAGFISGGYVFHTLKLLEYSLWLLIAIAALSAVVSIVLSARQKKLSAWRNWFPWDLLRLRVNRTPELSRLASALLISSFFLVLTIIWSIYRGISIPEPVNDLGTLVRNQIILGAANLYLIGFSVAVWSTYNSVLPASKYVVVFALGLGLTIGNGTSGGLTEISAFLGLSIVMAYLLTLACRYTISMLLPLSIFLSFTAVLVNEKFAAPYHWWAVTTSDIRTAACANAKDILAGLCIDPGTKSKIDEIVEEVNSRTLPTDEIYIFPHTPIFYLLTGRPPYARSPVSWFDFMSDSQAAYVSNQLRMSPPALLIVSQLPEVVFATHERLFRDGNNIGQREIMRAIDALESKDRIRKVRTIADVDGLNIVIYVRGQTSKRNPSRTKACPLLPCSGTHLGINSSDLT